MKAQEAIDILGQYDVSAIKFYWTDGEEIPFTDWSDAIETAILVLRKQIPEEPKVERIKPTMTGKKYYCPTCGELLGDTKFCDCGQCIRWEGE